MRPGVLYSEQRGGLAGQKLCGREDQEAPVFAGSRLFHLSPGDGFDDILIGAPYANGYPYGTGAVYLVLGPVSGDIDLRNADARLTGETPLDNVGSAVSGAGDTDRDGFADLLIGANLANGDPYQYWYNDGTGAAYLVLATSL